MAQFVNMFEVDLDKRSYPVSLNQTVSEGNVYSNRVGAYVYKDGAPINLGGACTGLVMRADGTTVPLTGFIEGNAAYVVLDQPSCAIPGPIQVAVNWVSGSNTTTLVVAYGTVIQTDTRDYVQPGTPIPDINTLLAAIEDMETATDAANAAATGALANFAGAFVQATAYPAGTYVTYTDGFMYVLPDGHEADVTWANTTKTKVTTGKELSDLKSALRNNVIDVLRFGDEPSSHTGGGITATKIRDGVFHFTGTISGSDFFTYYRNMNTFPDWLEKGRTYYLSVSGASDNNKIYFEVLGFRNGSAQISLSGMRYNNGLYGFTIPSNFVGGAFVRVGWLSSDSGTVVDETIEYHIYDAPLTGKETVQIAQTAVHFENKPFASCADVQSGIITFVASEAGVLSIPDFPFNAPGTLICMGVPSFPIQFALSWNQAEIAIKSRSKGLGGTWSNWVDSPIPSNTEQFKGWATQAGIESCDDINTISWYIVPSEGGVPYPSDFPFNCAGWIQTIPFNNWILQIAFSFANQMKTRTKNGSVWSSWKDIATGGQTVTITQEVSRDTYNNTYNIDVSPQITTDSNGWLQPVDTNTADETGKTDMTGAIMAMLNSTGYCHLAPGIYYVSGNIDMPADSMIEGCGKQTIIRLLQSVSSGYIVRMHTRSTLKNVCLSGGYSALDISTSNIGGRKGINYIGNRDGQSSGVTPTTCTCCQIEGCWFENLDSGFYGYNAGGGLQEGVEMSNCYFTRCKAGINIDYWTEYCKFTNIITFQCYYACINNGGNNVFTACTFHGVIGFLIDNSSGSKANAAHGTVNGCTFNHIDNMNHPETLGNGYGIKVIDTTAGFIFANCQIWYGKVYVEDSKGVQFADCEFGGYPTIETSGDEAVFFHGCIFQSAPTKTITSPVKFDNCYTYAGASVTN